MHLLRTVFNCVYSALVSIYGSRTVHEGLTQSKPPRPRRSLCHCGGVTNVFLIILGHS